MPKPTKDRHKQRLQGAGGQERIGRVPAQLDFEPELLLDEIDEYIRNCGYHIKAGDRVLRPTKQFLDRCRDHAASVLNDRAELYFHLFIKELVINIGVESIGVREEQACQLAGIPWKKEDSARFRKVGSRARRQLAALKNIGPLKARKGRPPKWGESEKAERRRLLVEEIRNARSEKMKSGQPYSIESVIPDIAEKWGESEGSLDHILRPRRKRPLSRPKLKTPRK